MKKIVLKNEACIGCGACIGIDSEHFEFSDDGYSVIKSQENLESPALSDAIDACPVAIISLEDDGKQILDKDLAIEANESECESCHSKDCHCENDDNHCEDCHCENDDNCYCEDKKEAA